MASSPLVDFDTRVRLRIYEEVIHARRWPSMAQLARLVDATEAEVRAACAGLYEAHVGIVPDSAGGELLFTAPFCAVPSPFVVAATFKSPSGQSVTGEWFAPCGWDAFGIVVMLGGTGTVHTACPCCAQAINVTIRDGKLQDESGWMNLIVPAKRFWENIVFT